MITKQERSIGCLLGGAYGDSLGAPVEFLSEEDIRRQYPRGLVTPLGFPGCGPGSITDDTQQTLAVCRGLLHGMRRGGSDAILAEDVWFQLKQWHELQLASPNERRSPGSTSMSALASSCPGTFEIPLNDGKSCGAVMRAHPIGLACAGDPERAFRLGCRVGALTHGHPDGYGPSGVLAAMIALIVEGATTDRAATVAINLMAREHSAAGWKTLQWLTIARDEDPTRLDAGLNRGAQGWDGGEALAIGLYAARRHAASLHRACEFAAILTGDSDSTASIAGAIVGCSLGASAVPYPWGERLEHAQELTQRGRELTALTQ